MWEQWKRLGKNERNETLPRYFLDLELYDSFRLDLFSTHLGKMFLSLPESKLWESKMAFFQTLCFNWKISLRTSRNGGMIFLNRCLRSGLRVMVFSVNYDTNVRLNELSWLIGYQSKMLEKVSQPKKIKMSKLWGLAKKPGSYWVNNRPSVFTKESRF